MQKNNLTEEIMEFLKVTYECYKTTNYAEDRKAFESDIALCVGWLISIYNDDNIQKTINDILDTSTSKHISDFYKQGIFGDKQAKAFTRLVNAMK